jgi:hypothetical protein
MAEPRVALCIYDLTRWYMERTNRFPKNYRITLGDQVDRHMLGMLSLVQRASVRREKTGLLMELNEDLNVLRALTRLCVDLGCLEVRQYEYVSRMIDEIGRQLGGWLKQQRRKESGCREKVEESVS